PIPWVYVEIVRHLHRGERVCILVNDAASEAAARRKLRRAGVDPGRVEFFPIPTDRVWTRDYGPYFLADAAGAVAATDWGFNGWAKYDNWKGDDAVAGQVAARLGLRCWRPEADGRRVVLEGGSFDVNGQGLLLTTEECLLSPVQARNPDMTRIQIERKLRDNLGVNTV